MIGQLNFFLSQFFETFITEITELILTLEVSLAGASGFRWVFWNYGGVQCVFLIRKIFFKLSIKLLAKIRFPILSKCKPLRKRLDVGMFL